MSDGQALAGRRIVVPESRELDLFAGMLERDGATTVRCPLVTILDADDPAPVEAWLRRLAAGAFDDLVLFTGEGVRRLMKVAREAGLEDGAVEGLRAARKIVRGPKPVKALRTLGLEPDVTAAAPTSIGLMETMSGLDLAGRCVGMQAYPGQDGSLDAFLTGKGATVARVLPYRYASDEEDARVAAVIRDMSEGQVDLIAFTARPQVKRLRDVAATHGLGTALEAAMARTRIAAVGPVCAEAVAEAGWQVAVAPGGSFHMKPLILALRRLFAEPSPDYG